jgi:hypothetical protein
MTKAPPIPKSGALHYKKIDKTIVVQGSAKNQDFEKIDQSNIGSRLQPGDVAKVQWYGQEVTVAKLWVQHDALPPRLRSWKCLLPGNENIWLELQAEVEA